MYTTGSVNERPVSVKNLVSEGHPSGFTRARYESKYYLADYEPNKNFQNLGHEMIISIRQKNSEII